MQVDGIMKHGYPLLDSGAVEWKDPLVPYLTTPLAFLSGLESSGMTRLISVLFGVGTVIVSFFFSRQIFGSQIAIVFTAIVSSSYLLIAWSQQVRGYSALIFFTFLFFWFLGKTRKRGCENQKYLWYALITVILGVLSNKLAVFLVVPFFVYVIAMRKLALIISGLIGLLAASFFFFDHFGNLISSLSNNTHFYVVQYVWNDFGVLALLAALGLIVALALHKRQLFHIAVAMWICAVFVVLNFFTATAEKRYVLMIIPFIYLYATYFTISLLSDEWLRSRIFVGVASIATLLLGVIAPQHFVTIPKKHYHLEDYTPQPDFRSAYLSISAHGFDSTDKIISPFPWMDHIYLNQTDYFFTWSLTGRPQDTTRYREKDFYTGARFIDGQKGSLAYSQVKDLREINDVYIIFDSLSLRRIDGGLVAQIMKDGELIYTSRASGDILHEEDVLVYYLARNPFGELFYDNVVK